jgi:enterochelin esterase-like enzyme
MSMAGAQALRIGFHHLNQFAFIGAFSPAIAITDPTKDYDGILAHPAKLNQRVRVLWLGIGSEDFLFAPVKDSHEALKKAGIHHVWVESPGAHVWTAWRKYLADFAPRIFQ